MSELEERILRDIEKSGFPLEIEVGPSSATNLGVFGIKLSFWIATRTRAVTSIYQRLKQAISLGYSTRL